jgi:hypothetical protein
LEIYATSSKYLALGILLICTYINSPIQLCNMAWASPSRRSCSPPPWAFIV